MPNNMLLPKEPPLANQNGLIEKWMPSRMCLMQRQAAAPAKEPVSAYIVPIRVSWKDLSDLVNSDNGLFTIRTPINDAIIENISHLLIDSLNST